ncbi:protein arginine kinase [Kiritimatiellota bacterium B12222]|nr:protein arginine kinase [Kiritimatiellota bacterium B12222]
MTLDELLDTPCTWFFDHAPSEIAISSRIRLARNLQGFSFPAHASMEDRIRIRAHALDVLRKNDHFQEGFFYEMDDVTPFQKQLLYERSLISKDLAEECPQAGLAVSQDLRDVVMINEEDHLRLQVMRSGLCLEEIWEEIASVDDDLEAAMEVAFSEEFGYLTCCPTNTGTGMRAGVMLHLPGLVLMEEIRPVIKGLGKMGLAVRGLGGEGSDADGFLYQISNQITLGRSEIDLMQDIQEVVKEVIGHEQNARLRLAESKQAWLKDRVGRAFGVLQNAHVLASKEALDLLAMVRLGLALELLEWDEGHQVEQLMVDVRPAHLQKCANEKLDAEKRDIFRAEWVRSRLADLKKGRKL